MQMFKYDTEQRDFLHFITHQVKLINMPKDRELAHHGAAFFSSVGLSHQLLALIFRENFHKKRNNPKELPEAVTPVMQES